MKTTVPEIRIAEANKAPPNSSGGFVLYWMIANRRTTWNFALQRAVDWSRELKKPLVILEALRSGYRWASDRIHRFVIEGMADNAHALARRSVLYYPYVEPQPDAGRGLLKSLAEHACVIVTDEFPCFFLPRMVEAAAGRLNVRVELVDSNGIFPLRAPNRTLARAYDFRRFLQKNLREHLEQFPEADPLSGVRIPKLTQLPSDITDRWPESDVKHIAESPDRLAELPIDHSVAVVTSSPGGAVAATKRLEEFRRHKLHRYKKSRNEPQQDVTSGLSPYLHFGHISAHQVFSEIMDDEQWAPSNLANESKGSRIGWWGCGPNAEAFLDELITWRELGYNMCTREDDYDQYESLPDWAQQTLEDHAGDKREHVYSVEEFESAATHDDLWNAAQSQLLREGRIHNYLRMLWGKKILEWSESPRTALEIMIELNNKYGLDGRDPNSYSGIFWVLGRYDRPWGPERPIFGKVRYMSCENTARKVKVIEYVKQYAPPRDG